jgi:hypothetical protein
VSPGFVIGAAAALVAFVAVAAIARIRRPNWLALVAMSLLTGLVSGGFAAVAGSTFAGGLLAIVLISLQAADAWRSTRVARLERALHDPERRLRAADALVDELNRESEGPAVLLEAAGQLVVAGLDDHAEVVLALMDVSSLEVRHLATLGLYRSILHLRQGELDQAQAMLARERRAGDPATRQGLRAMRGLLSALDGEGSSVLEDLEALPDRCAHPIIDGLACSARIHALATSDGDAAAQALTALADDGRWPTIENIRAQGGPASKLADRVLQEHVGPYR